MDGKRSFSKKEVIANGRKKEARQWCWPDGAEKWCTALEGNKINYIEGLVNVEILL